MRETGTSPTSRLAVGYQATVHNSNRDTTPNRLRRMFKIGEGGFGVVEVALYYDDYGLPHLVALKLLNERYDLDTLTQFRDEYRIQKQVVHSNIVHARSITSFDGRLGIVMDYVPGVPLSQLLKLLAGKPCPVAVAVRIMIDALHGLHGAHEQISELTGKHLQIVHRDVAPKNIIIGEDGISRILDFGIAKAEERTQNTQGASRKGTPGYMSPERLRGEIVDRREDLYCASIVMWEMLVGRRLFAADGDATVKGGAGGPRSIERPSQTRSDVPSELDEIVMRGLHSDRENRFATAGEMASALRGAVKPADHTVVQEWLAELAREDLEERAAQIKSWIRRNKIVPRRSTALVVLSTALAIAIALLVRWHRGQPAPECNPTATPTTEHSSAPTATVQHFASAEAITSASSAPSSMPSATQSAQPTSSSAERKPVKLPNTGRPTLTAGVPPPQPIPQDPPRPGKRPGPR